MKSEVLINIRRQYRHLLRMSYNKEIRDRLNNHDFSIISQNCVGGVIYHELNQKFLSPTINMYMSAQDYIKLISNLKQNMLSDFKEIKSNYSYPMAEIGGEVQLHLVHYDSFEEAKIKWIERRNRINWDNLYFIMCDRDGCTLNEIKAFDALPYKNKALLTYKQLPGIRSVVTLDGTKDNDHIIDLCGYPSKFTGLRYLDKWDYVSFLNTKQ